MGLFDWFRGRSALSTMSLTPAPIAPEKQGFRFLVLMEQVAFAELINQATPFVADHARTLSEGLAALDRNEYHGVLALSPMSDSGSAVRLIAAFRERRPKGLCIYHGWDYRVELSGVPAERCGADFLVVGGVMAEELVGFFPVAVELHRQGTVPRPSLEWYTQSLREYFPRSPFWNLAEQFRARGMPPSEYE
jgi:hypothetical protein